MTKALSLSARIALLVALVMLAVWTIYHPTLTRATERRDEAITEVVSKGPVEVDGAEWTIESFKAYTRLVDDERKPVALDVPAGATVIVAVVTIKATDKVVLKEGGFTCSAQLIDEDDNRWKEESSLFGMSMPTSCSDDDHPFTRGKSNKVMKVFVVPAASVPKLLGLVTPPTGSSTEGKRVLITP